MTIDNTVAFVTGANRGIGAALVEVKFYGVLNTTRAFASTLADLLKGIEADEEDILPDPMSRQLYANWVTDHKAVERRFAAM